MSLARGAPSQFGVDTCGAPVAPDHDVCFRLGRPRTAPRCAALPDGAQLLLLRAVRGMLRAAGGEGLPCATSRTRYVYLPTAEPEEVSQNGAAALLRRFFRQLPRVRRGALLDLSRPAVSRKTSTKRLSRLLDEARDRRGRMTRFSMTDAPRVCSPPPAGEGHPGVAWLGPGGRVHLVLSRRIGGHAAPGVGARQSAPWLGAAGAPRWFLSRVNVAVMTETLRCHCPRSRRSGDGLCEPVVQDIPRASPAAPMPEGGRSHPRGVDRGGSTRPGRVGADGARGRGTWVSVARLAKSATVLDCAPEWAEMLARPGVGGRVNRPVRLLRSARAPP
jgi:hypothetical protein